MELGNVPMFSLTRDAGHAAMTERRIGAWCAMGEDRRGDVTLVRHVAPS